MLERPDWLLGLLKRKIGKGPERVYRITTLSEEFAVACNRLGYIPSYTQLERAWPRALHQHINQVYRW